MKLENWHHRYVLQSYWTQRLRAYIAAKLNVQKGQTVLEVGSGTGALIPPFTARGLRFFGVDKDASRVIFAHDAHPEAYLSCAEAETLPIKSDFFDYAVCHYLLLWLKEPELTLGEMTRVTKPLGHVIAFAEPDYLGRIDHPELYSWIGEVQNHSLKVQGVNLSIGRKLGDLFKQCGLVNITTGLLAGEWVQPPNPDVFEDEWNIIAFDLAGFVKIEDLVRLKSECEALWLSGRALAYIPTFYAYGQKP